MTDVTYGSKGSEDFWAWFGPKLDAAAPRKATPVAPRRAPRPIEGQTFSPEPSAPARRWTQDELRFINEGRREVTRREVRELMRNPNRVGVCG